MSNVTVLREDEGHPPYISIVIPTITGREEWAFRAVEAYKETTPQYEIIIVLDEPSCGHGWQAGYEHSTAPYVHFTADDITPKINWWRDPIVVVDQGHVPIAHVDAPNGNRLHCFSPLGGLGKVSNILVPFLSRKQLEEGGWLPLFHYGSDDWVTYLAAKRGKRLKECPGYRLIHHVAPEGRNYLRRHADVLKLVQAMEREGYVPPVYRQLEINLRASVTGLDSVSLKQLELDIEAGRVVPGQSPDEQKALRKLRNQQKIRERRLQQREHS